MGLDLLLGLKERGDERGWDERLIDDDVSDDDCVVALVSGRALAFDKSR